MPATIVPSLYSSLFLRASFQPNLPPIHKSPALQEWVWFQIWLLLSVTNYWHQQLSKDHQIAAVFNVKMAFDSVPHTLILQSLSSVGISGPLLSWFMDYLTGRQQRVVVDEVSSTLSPVRSGIPQGSILGPQLFIIFMNSINYLPLSPGSKLMLHADVVVLYRPTNSPEDINIIQEDINQILNWTKAHSLILNSAKTFYLSLALPSQFTSILDQISSKLSAPGCYHSGQRASSSVNLAKKASFGGPERLIFVKPSIWKITPFGVDCLNRKSSACRSEDLHALLRANTTTSLLDSSLSGKSVSCDCDWI